METFNRRAVTPRLRGTPNGVLVAGIDDLRVLASG
jgi:hypothetical protein